MPILVEQWVDFLKAGMRAALVDGQMHLRTAGRSTASPTWKRHVGTPLDKSAIALRPMPVLVVHEQLFAETLGM